MRNVSACAVLLAAVALPARADAPPRVLPAHDVAVRYRTTGAAADSIPSLAGRGAGPVTEVQLAWDAGGRQLRAEAEGRPQYVIVNLPGHRTTVLDDGMHAALLLPMRDTDVEALTMANARFTRRGSETVAGERCTDWAVQSARGTGTVCLTEDGVPLRGDGTVNGRAGAFTATRIDRGALPAETFTVPAGYTLLELPRLNTR